MIIICDVDDTVAPSCQPIEPEMAQLIYDRSTGGDTFVFISGSTCQQIFNQINGGLYAYRRMPTYHILGTSGSRYEIIIDNDKSTLIYEISMLPSHRVTIISIMEKLCKLKGLVPLTNKEDQIQNRVSQITLSVLGRHAPVEAKKNLDPSGEKRREWIKVMKSIAKEGLHKIHDFDFHIGGTTSIDVTLMGRDKEWGIQRWLDHNEWANVSDIVFFGDKLEPGGNDHPATEIISRCISVTDPMDCYQKLSEL